MCYTLLQSQMDVQNMNITSYTGEAQVAPKLRRSRFGKTMHAVVLCLVVALASVAADSPGAKDPVVQFSTLNALAAGHFEGTWPYDEVRGYGDFGIGTLDGLDGETIMLDGEMFQAKADGTVLPVPAKALIPFVTVTTFRPSKSASLAAAASTEQLAALLDQLLPQDDCFYAVRIDATFSAVKIRSCPKQTPPFRPLAEVTKEQAVFDLQNVTGTLVGFRYPKYIQGLNMAGYHLHFISSDRKAGGHMLNCAFLEASVKADLNQQFRLFLLPLPK